MICVGGGSHFRDIEAIAHRAGITNITVYDDDPETDWPQPPDHMRGPLLIGSNYPKFRKAIAERYPHLRGAAPLIDPSAVVGPDCHFGHGVVVSAQTALIASVTLGNHVHVGYHVGLTRCLVGDYSTLSPGSTICGDVTIGEACLIGAGATICDRSSIGNFVTVGAGAIVPPLSRVPDGERVLGVWGKRDETIR